MSKSVIPESWLPIMRIIEFVGVLVAIVVVLFDFIVDRPADRIIRAWVVIAQSPGAEGNIGQIAALTVLNKAGQDVRGVNLRSAWLVRANLRGFKLNRANLTGANFTGADLTRANLTRANLTVANLTGANLTGADLTDAHVSREQLDSACISKGGKPPTLPDGLKPPQRVCVP